MDTRLQSILDDLYVADPSLRAHDAQVRKIVMAMLAVRPQIVIDEAFRAELRAKLMARAGERASAPAQNLISSFITYFSMNRLSYAVGGAVLAVVLIVPVVYFTTNSFQSTGSVALRDTGSSGRLSFVPTVAPVDGNAFGSLQTPNAQGAPQGLGAGPAASPEAAADSKMAAGFGGGGGGAVGSMIYPPADYVQYRYIYKGDDITLDGAAINVLKRIKGGVSGSSLAQFLRNFNFEGINLKSFSDAMLQNINFIQNKEYGYNINISLTEGNVSIGENWEKWYPCVDGVCPQLNPLTIDQVPADDRVIAIANAFVKEHSIDVSKYGAPEVQGEWRVMYDRAVSKEGFYIPDMLTVVYPLIIDGKAVYDDGGNKSGIRVNVNIRLMRASGLWDLNTQNYQSSSYAAVTDIEQVLKVAERGGIYGYVVDGGKTVDVEIGTPTVAYLKHWNYRNGVSDELLVPSLVFPILKAPDDVTFFYRSAVIVPLAQELLDMQGSDLPVRIMPAEPLTEPATAPETAPAQ